MEGKTPAQLYALVVGAVLVLVGILGFFYNASFGVGDSVERDALLGIFDINGWHNVVHLATGALLLAVAGKAPAAKAVVTAYGAIYVVVFILGLIAGDGGEILGLIPINTEDNILHIALALTGLGAGLASKAHEGPGRGEPATAR